MVIARLIADASDLETRLAAMVRGIRHSDLIFAEPDAVWLGESHEILQLEFDTSEPQMAVNIIETHFPDCDFLMKSDPNARIDLVVSDMDSTMIGQECIDELADYAGIKDQIAAITERAMQGEIDFENALRERVALLAGLDESAIDRCLEERIRPNPGARELIQGLKAKGARTVLVTGGFDHFADKVAEQIGFDRVVGNRLAVKDGKLTGELDGPISDASTKARVLAEESAKLGEGGVSLALGDGANDIPMIEAATYGIAYMAKPKAKAAADGQIESGNLANVLTLLGVR
ncbi:MAG: phosphoserine phosphatase SerB [Pseudomonadota bacterium]